MSRQGRPDSFSAGSGMPVSAASASKTISSGVQLRKSVEVTRPTLRYGWPTASAASSRCWVALTRV